MFRVKLMNLMKINYRIRKNRPILTKQREKRNDDVLVKGVHLKPLGKHFKLN